MKIVVAPDSFKGSISARDICTAVHKGILRVFQNADVVEIPLADGGEGTMENMVYSSNGTKKQVEVTGPLGEKVKAEYGILGDHETVVVEMAQSSGLPLLKESERNPMITSTFGTGELIKDALDNGFRKFIVGIGGSATNDGGMGMLKALGVKFYKRDCSLLSEGGASLIQLHHFDESNLDARVKECKFIVASDVTNTLCGPNGASAIFGPQKGATPEMVKKLDEALNNFADVVHKQKNMDMRKLVGGGAAGGLGAGLITFLGAELQSGIEVMMKELHFEEKIKDADLIITGEGRLDSQTLSGKLITGVSKAAKKYEVPVIALCGGLTIETNQVDELGLLSAFSIVPGPCPLEEAMKQAASWIPARVEAIMRIIKYQWSI
ncbi:glycerate kinase [Schinkia sp. CFF1]